MGTISSDTPTAFERLADVLALMPDVIARLLTDHTSDSTGRCRGCTRPGTGYPAAVHPCTLHRLATMALIARTRTNDS
jgi:hypothetical protein